MEISSSFCYLLLNVDEVLRRTISRIQKNKEDSSYTGEDFGSNIENFEFIIENIKAAAEGMAFTSDFSQKNYSSGFFRASTSISLSFCEGTFTQR